MSHFNRFTFDKLSVIGYHEVPVTLGRQLTEIYQVKSSKTVIFAPYTKEDRYIDDGVFSDFAQFLELAANEEMTVLEKSVSAKPGYSLYIDTGGEVHYWPEWLVFNLSEQVHWESNEKMYDY